MNSQSSEVHDIETSSETATCRRSRTNRTRRTPKQFDDSVIYESTGARESTEEHISDSQYYKVNLYFPVLDAFLSELKRRFSDKNREIMRAIQACNPTSKSFLDPEYLEPMTSMYGLNSDLVKLESPLAKRILANKEMEDVSDVVLALAPLGDAFPTVLHLLQIAMTISVSSASCTRSFSTLKRIKTYLRSTMTEQRLNDYPLNETFLTV